MVTASFSWQVDFLMKGKSTGIFLEGRGEMLGIVGLYFLLEFCGEWSSLKIWFKSEFEMILSMQ